MITILNDKGEKLEDILVIFVYICFYIIFTLFGYFFYKLKKDSQFILDVFAKSNIIVDGAKGTGKDILFSYVARHQGQHYSNIRYNANTILANVSDFSCAPNIYSDFISGKYILCNKTKLEHTDFFISDGGVILPSHCDSELKKIYPSFPIYYALSRHLTNSNIHVNSQNYERIWKPLREQADGFFHCTKTKIYNFFCFKLSFTHCIYYSQEKGIASALQPVNVSALAPDWVKEQAADQYHKYGTVRSLLLVQLISRDTYDNRAYHKYLYGFPAPKK